MTKKVVKFKIHDISKNRDYGTYGSKEEAIMYIIHSHLVPDVGIDVVNEHINNRTIERFAAAKGYKAIRLWLNR